MTSVLVVDDHPIVVKGCRTVLSDLGIEDLLEASSVVCGYRAYMRRRPDVAIIDLTFEGDDLAGLSLVGRIAQKDSAARILVFSMHNNPSIVSRVLAHGALGYVIKDKASAELATAFEQVVAGKPYLSHDLAMQIAMLRARGDESPLRDLTNREIQILELLARGNGYDKIASRLGVSYKTVTNASSAMRTKLPTAT